MTAALPQGEDKVRAVRSMFGPGKPSSRWRVNGSSTAHRDRMARITSLWVRSLLRAVKQIPIR